MPRLYFAHFLLACCLMLAAAESSHAQATGEAGAAEGRGGAIAILIRNPGNEPGQPPFALADQFGRVQRLVEPSPRMSLDRFVGQRVRIKHDTGRTLLASQLDLPEADALLPAEEPSELRKVSPAQFVPPGRVTRLDEVETTIERNGRKYRVIPVQLADEAESVGAEPIDLDSILADETPASESLPGPSRRLDPIPMDSDSYEANDDYRTISPVQEGSGCNDPDCPHCRKHRHASGHVVHGTTDASSHNCECSQCQAKPAPSVNLCKSCGRGPGWCGPSCSPASRRGFYGRAEYLLWKFNGFDTPSLAVTNDLGNAPIPGVAGTRSLYGGELLDGSRSGMRYTIGFWFDENRDLAIEADWAWFETETDVFTLDVPAGNFAFGRPFYNVAPVDGVGAVQPPANDVQLITGGDLAITARSRFQTGGIRLRTGICCREIGGCTPNNACGCSACVGGGLLGLGSRRGTQAISRIDFIGGYRFAELEEQLLFQEAGLTLANGGTLDGSEAFEVDNDFHGVDLGFVYQWQSRRWGLELLSRIALGQTSQEIAISGSNTVGATGIAGVTTPGLLLAQDSNIGVYSRDRFSVLPELSARLSYRITPQLSLTGAYTVLYWANVVRPQFDYSVDGRLASGQLVAADLNSHPRVMLNESSLWAHGLNFGLEYNY